MKKTILLVLLLIVLAACARQAPQAEQEVADLPPKPNPEPPAISPSGDQLTQEQTQNTQAKGVKKFDIEAKRFEFTPSDVNVKEGDRVRLTITSTDVGHGISIPEFGVNEVLPPGEEITIEFTADKKGDYPFVCSVYCGNRHQQMRGTLHVN